VRYYFAEKFTQVLKKQQEERSDRERDRIRLLGADPFDAEAQQKIAEEIRLEQTSMLNVY
jgi:DNA damage-inducible protein 1